MKARLIVVLFAIITSILPAIGRQLTPEESFARYSRLRSVRSTRGTAPQFISSVNADKEPSFTGVYVFTTGTGFVVLSADDAVAPLLGYGYGVFKSSEEIPAPMRKLLKTYADEIYNTASTGAGFSLQSRAVPASSDWVEIPPLITSLWGQAYPYNALVPGDQVNQVGCVALSMGQVMRYHQWPIKGKGTISYRINIPGFYDQPVSVDFSELTFDWANMPNAIAKSSPEIRIKAISTLLMATGASVCMNYGQAESLAYSEMEAPALYKYFDYSELMRHVQADYYSPGEWTGMVYNQLSQGIPLIYGGTGNYGHSFICDGFRNDDDNLYFHFNWGWNGVGNGYFLLSNLRPQTGFGEGVFNKDIEMVINMVKPGTEIKNIEKEPLLYSVDKAILDHSQEAVLGELSPEFFFKNGGIKNTGVKEIRGKAGMLFTNDETGIRYFSYEASLRTIKPAEYRGTVEEGNHYTDNSTGAFQTVLPSEMEEGVYTGVPVFQPEGSEDFLRVLGPVAGRTCLKMIVEGDKAVFESGDQRLVVYNIDPSVTAGEDDFAQIRCTVYNPFNSDTDVSLAVRFMDTDGEISTPDVTPIDLYLAKGEETTVLFSDIPYDRGSLSTPPYSIEIYDALTGSPLGLTCVKDPVFDPAAAAVAEIKVTEMPKEIFNLQGIKVDRNRLGEGIYIFNGRKVRFIN